MWRSLLRTAQSNSLYNWTATLSKLDMGSFKERYLDPAPGYARMIMCPDHEKCNECECNKMRPIRDLSTGTAGCCPYNVTIPPIYLSARDQEMYRLSFSRFHASICQLCGLEFSGTPLDSTFFWELGSFKNGAARYLPVYISYYLVPSLLEQKVRQLIAQNKTPFALIVFDYAVVPRSVVDELKANKCACVAISELIRMDARAEMSLSIDNPARIFNIYKEEAITSTSGVYDCPATVKWGDIHINLLDGETITVWRRGEAARAFSHVSMGLASSKNNQPTKVFKFLVSILEHGCDHLPVPAKTTAYYKELVQRKRELNNALKAFFPAVDDGDPLVFDNATQSYLIRFRTKPLPPSA